MTFGIFAAYYFLGILCLAAGFYGAEAFSDYCQGTDFDYWNRFDLFNYVKEINSTYIGLNKQLMCTDVCPCHELSNLSKFSTYSSSLIGKNFTGKNSNINDCLNNEDYSYLWDYDVINYLKELESKYKCTGLCKA